MMQRTLLIVDSDVFQQQLIDMLLAVDDYKIITATTGREALEQLKTTTPELTILADNLPDTKGADLCARIRGVRRFQQMPVILTCSADNEEAVHSLVPAVQASLALSKPLGNKRLRERVRDLISDAPPRIYEADPHSADPGQDAKLQEPDRAPKPTLPQTFEVKDSDTALSSRETPAESEAPTHQTEQLSQEVYVRSILARGSVVPMTEENVARLSRIEPQEAQTVPAEARPEPTAQPDKASPDKASTELDEDLLLTEADLTELTIYTDMDIQPNALLFSDSPATVRPAASFVQDAQVAGLSVDDLVPEEVKAALPPRPIELENFADNADVHVTATRPTKLTTQDGAELLEHTQESPPMLSVNMDSLLEDKKPQSRKLSTLVEQPFSVEPSKRELNAPKPKPNKPNVQSEDDAVAREHAEPPKDMNKNPASAANQDLLHERELEQLNAQIETLLAENDQLKEALRELEQDQPMGTSESYLDAVEELEALRRLTEHQSRQLTKLYGENRYLRERQQAPLKPEPPRKTIWDKLKL